MANKNSRWNVALTEGDVYKQAFTQQLSTQRRQRVVMRTDLIEELKGFMVEWLNYSASPECLGPRGCSVLDSGGDVFWQAMSACLPKETYGYLYESTGKMRFDFEHLLVACTCIQRLHGETPELNTLRGVFYRIGMRQLYKALQAHMNMPKGIKKNILTPSLVPDKEAGDLVMRGSPIAHWRLMAYLTAPEMDNLFIINVPPINARKMVVREIIHAQERNFGEFINTPKSVLLRGADPMMETILLPRILSGNYVQALTPYAHKLLRKYLQGDFLAYKAHTTGAKPATDSPYVERIQPAYAKYLGRFIYEFNTICERYSLPRETACIYYLASGFVAFGFSMRNRGYFLPLLDSFNAMSLNNSFNKELLCSYMIL